MSLCRQKPAVKSAAVKISGDPSSPAVKCCVACVTKLVRKLKRKGKLLLSATGRQSSFQCRYDPLSYSLNFDGGACGSLADDEDYYLRFYAFSSRFVDNKRPPTPCETMAAASH